jgi:quinol monooxygenase YgiN
VLFILQTQPNGKGTTMLIAIVDFEVMEQDRAAALAALLDEVSTVQAIAGCINFRPYTDPQRKTHVGVLHEWDDGDGFAAYLASPEFSNVGTILRPMMTAPPSSRRYKAELIENVA